MILPYYRIEKTEEGREFFYSHFGYFNFFDEYLILNTKESEGKLFAVLVNRNGAKFEEATPTEEQKESWKAAISDSVCIREPEEMFDDFPELNRYDFLKKYSEYYQEENNYES